MRIVGSTKVKGLITEALTMLPEDIQEYITNNVWFLSSFPDAWAYTFTGADIPDKHLIILSDELFSEPKSQIQYTILHEIGHVILKHKNSINYKQTKQEIEKQEDEADRFAKLYLNQ